MLKGNLWFIYRRSSKVNCKNRIVIDTKKYTVRTYRENMKTRHRVKIKSSTEDIMIASRVMAMRDKGQCIFYQEGDE
jgi:hypothetical protein